MCDCSGQQEQYINSGWETMRAKIKISAKKSLGYYELKKYKPWFNEIK
jgi:hypothetical protein